MKTNCIEHLFYSCPLHAAVQHNDDDKARRLIEEGAEVYTEYLLSLSHHS